MSSVRSVGTISKRTPSIYLQVKSYVHYTNINIIRPLTNHKLYVHYTNIRTLLANKLQFTLLSLHIPDEPDLRQKDGIYSRQDNKPHLQAQCLYILYLIGVKMAVAGDNYLSGILVCEPTESLLVHLARAYIHKVAYAYALATLATA